MPGDFQSDLLNKLTTWNYSSSYKKLEEDVLQSFYM